MTIQTNTFKKLDNLKPPPKYQIIDENGEVHFQFHSIDWLINSEIFSYRERYNLRNFEPIKNGRYKGFRMVEI